MALSFTPGPKCSPQTERALWQFYEKTAFELNAANTAQRIAHARFEACVDVMEGMVAAGLVRPREQVLLR